MLKFATIMITDELSLDSMGVVSFEFEDDKQEEVEVEDTITEEQEEDVEVEDTEEPTEESSEESTEEVETDEEVEQDTELDHKEDDNIDISTHVGLKDKFLADGTWENAIVEIDGEEIELKDLKDLTPEMFDQIHAEQRALQSNEVKDKYISKGDFSEMHLNMIELMKSGATTEQMKEAMDYKERLIDPLSSYDLGNVAHQEQLVGHVLSENNKGLSSEAISFELNRMKQAGQLGTVAQNYANKIKENYNNALKQKSLALQEENNKKISDHQELTKKVVEALDNVKVKNSIKSTVQKFYSNDFNNENIIEEINKIKTDPDKLARTLLFLTDEEEYNRVYNVDPKLQEGSKVLTKMSLSPQTKGKKTTSKRPKVSDLDLELANKLEL